MAEFNSNNRANKRPDKGGKNRQSPKNRRGLVIFSLFSLLIVILSSILVTSLVDSLRKKTSGSDNSEGNAVETNESLIETASETVLNTASSDIPVQQDTPSESPSTEPSSPENNTIKETKTVSYATKNGMSVNISGELRCQAGILIDVDSNTVICYSNEESRIYPASLTKIMTLITAYEHCSDPDTETFTMTYEILHPLVSSGDSRAGFEVGETNSIKDYMYSLILPSGADAACGLAVYIGGTVENFVEMMNETANKMGLKNTHFTNPIGEHDANNYSSAHDIALMLKYAYSYPYLKQILDTYTYYTESTQLHPSGIYMESNLQQRMKGDESGTCYVSGGKTGYTREAGHCAACFATSNLTGKRYIFVATGGAAMYNPINDCIDILKKYVN